MNRNHKHDIVDVQWPGRPMRTHIHLYSTPTTFNQGHRHIVQGMTSGPTAAGSSHVHYYEGVTTFDDGHTHGFRGWTGLAIPLPGGGHYHEFAGETSFNDGHTHYYRGRTGRNRPY